MRRFKHIHARDMWRWRARGRAPWAWTRRAYGSAGAPRVTLPHCRARTSPLAGRRGRKTPPRALTHATCNSTKRLAYAHLWRATRLPALWRLGGREQDVATRKLPIHTATLYLYARTCHCRISPTLAPFIGGHAGTPRRRAAATYRQYYQPPEYDTRRHHTTFRTPHATCRVAQRATAHAAPLPAACRRHCTLSPFLPHTARHCMALHLLLLSVLEHGALRISQDISAACCCHLTAILHCGCWHLLYTLRATHTQLCCCMPHLPSCHAHCFRHGSSSLQPPVLLWHFFACALFAVSV